MLRDLLRQEVVQVGRLHVATLMKRRRTKAIYRRPNTSKPALGHKIYPYLLRQLAVTRTNQVWATDSTYIPMARAFVDLVAPSTGSGQAPSTGSPWRVLAWRVSISLDAGFCIEALEEALARYGKPAIFNSDQGSQLTSTACTAVLYREKIAIRIEGKGYWRGNVFVERRWRSVKYEEYTSIPTPRSPTPAPVSGDTSASTTPSGRTWRPHAQPDILRPAATRSGMINQRRSTYRDREPVQTNRATAQPCRHPHRISHFSSHVKVYRHPCELERYW